MRSRSDCPGLTNFNFGTTSVFNNINSNNSNFVPISPNQFLLLDGENFMLLDGENFLLLGT